MKTIKNRSSLISLIAAASVLLTTPADARHYRHARAHRTHVAVLSPSSNSAQPDTDAAPPTDDQTLVLELKTGKIYTPQGDVVAAKIISGTDMLLFKGQFDARNNSKYEGISGRGPIPARTYRVESERSSAKLGRPVMNLEPVDGKKPYGRFGFLIHERLGRERQWGSFGCVTTLDEETFEKLARLRAKGQFLFLRVLPSTETFAPVMIAEKTKPAVAPARPQSVAAVTPQPKAPALETVASVQSAPCTQDSRSFNCRWIEFPQP